MIVCPRCKKAHDDESLYCGYCGTSLISAKFMFDGKKNKRNIIFANKLYHSITFNIMYIVSFVVFLIVALSLFLISLNNIIDKIPSLEYHINQIMIKYSYLTEGVSIAYISEQAVFIINLLICFVLGILSFVDIFICIFHIFYGSYLLYHKYQMAKGNRIGKPVAITKLNGSIAKFSSVFNTVFILLAVALYIIKLTWM